MLPAVHTGRGADRWPDTFSANSSLEWLLEEAAYTVQFAEVSRVVTGEVGRHIADLLEGDILLVVVEADIGVFLVVEDTDLAEPRRTQIVSHDPI